MALINLALDQLERIESKISGIDNELISKMLPQISSAINSIADNVQGSELQPLVKKIDTQFETVKGGLTKGFSSLEGFLKGQLKSYRMTEQEAEQELVKTLNKMNDISGGEIGIDAVLSGISAILNKITDPSNKESFWSDITENWTGLQKNDGFFGKVGAIQDGIVRTGIDVVDGVVENVGDGANFIADKIGDAANGIYDGVARGVEGVGKGTFFEPVTNIASKGIDMVGDGVNYVFDGMGKVVNHVSEVPGNISNTVSDVLKNKVFDGDFNIFE